MSCALPMWPERRHSGLQWAENLQTSDGKSPNELDTCNICNRERAWVHPILEGHTQSLPSAPPAWSSTELRSALRPTPSTLPGSGSSCGLYVCYCKLWLYGRADPSKMLRLWTLMRTGNQHLQSLDFCQMLVCGLRNHWKISFRADMKISTSNLDCSAFSRGFFCFP